MRNTANFGGNAEPIEQFDYEPIAILEIPSSPSRSTQQPLSPKMTALRNIACRLHLSPLSQTEVGAAPERRLEAGIDCKHHRWWLSLLTAFIATTTLSGCTSGFDQPNDDFKLPFARPDKQRLARMVDEFCAPDDQMASADQLPMNGRLVSIPPALWQHDLPVHILFASCNYAVRPRATYVHLPTGGILVAAPESPVSLDLLQAMSIVDGIEIADTKDADAILQSLQSFGQEFLLLRDLKLGKAGVEAINKMPNLKALVMYGINTDSLASLDPSKLRELSVKAIDPDEQLALLLQNCKTMNNLTTLALDDSVISDKMNGAARKVPSLKRLAFDGSTLTDSQLAPWLASCNLTDLGLHDTPVTDDGLNLLKSQTSLESLNISRCHSITDQGLIAVANLPNLRKIDLCNSAVSDQGVLYLSRSPRLESLALANTSITSTCLPRFTAFKCLQFLGLDGNNLPVDRIQRLRQQMPHCRMQ
ncbi:MAG TPA: hypothetical protein V6C69_08055 [Trichormus sp.]